jgi:uncharacterized membrane protein
MNKKRKNDPSVKKTVSAGETNHTSIAQLTHQQFSGPVPHPEILRQYDQILPGAAERILMMAEDDARHQRKMELTAMNLTAQEVKRGQRFGLTIGISAFLTTVIALFLGSENTAMVLGGTTVVGLVTVFITGRPRQGKNNTCFSVVINYKIGFRHVWLLIFMHEREKLKGYKKI